MPNKMLIDASHQEETRVVVVHGNRIEEFDFESENKKQLKGNIYLARVTRVEPSLQAAFVEYGGNRHGFLAFSEIHPDYYQIPVADRQALLRADAEDAMAEDEEEEVNEERSNRRRRRGRSRGRASDASNMSADNGDDEATVDAESAPGDDADAATVEAEGASETNDDVSGTVMAESISTDSVSEEISSSSSDSDDEQAEAAIETVEEIGADSDNDDGDSQGDDGDDDHHDDENGDSDENGNGDDEIVSVGADDALDEVQPRRRAPRKQYKIQEVIKRRQILLVQVVKEERGNKGAALTTYMSLAGRYSVLMPNTARGGGISRKITNVADRKRLKEVVKDLGVPQGMGVILRTAGESRTKAEIKRDYEYLMRMWDNVRELTLKSSAPALVYEEGSLIKRSVRDLYNKDINQILVAGEEGYREAKDFMRMLMPSHAKVVQPYRDSVPIFARNGIEGQLDRMVQPQVTLKSGGYIIINQTEALVAVDVNSGRSTKEHSIEDTALQTNLEAAEEVSRQLRLRDLAGLIVIDFIDMEENRNNRAVEKRLKDCLKNDRARIQVGRISHFGLLEMSRQRLRASVLESTMQVCAHCGGTGHVRSESSVALLVIRAIEEFLLKESRHHITVRMPVSTALYVLNHKRATLGDLESRFGLTITIEADDSLHSQHYAIAKGAFAERPEGFVPFVPQITEIVDDVDDIIDVIDDAEDGEDEETTTQQSASNGDEEGDGQNRRRRRRRRRSRGSRDNGEAETAAADGAGDNEEGESSEDAADDAVAESEASSESETSDSGDTDEQPKKRRRGKRGGRRTRRDETGSEEAISAEGEEASDDASDQAGDEAVSEPVLTAEVATDVETVAEEPAALVDEAAQAAIEDAPVASAEVTAEVEAAEVPAPKAAAKPRRAPRRTTKKATTESAVEQQPVEPEVVEAVIALDAEPVQEEEAPKPKPRRAPRRKPVAKPVVEEATEAVTSETVTTEIAKEPQDVVETTPETKTEAAASPEVQDVASAQEAAPVVQVVDTTPSEPVVTSNGEAVEEEAKPRRGGWWQRKGFF